MFKHHALFGVLVSAALGIPYAASEWQSMSSWLTDSNPTYSARTGESLDVQRDSLRTTALLRGDESQPRLQTQSTAQTPSSPSWFRTISESESMTVEETAHDAVRAREELGREMIERARVNSTPTREISNGTASKEAAPGLPPGLRPDDPIPGPKFSDLGLVLLHEAWTLDVTEAYVIQRWPRVNTGLTDKDLRGFRVPYLSGSNEDDPAGALTFYFNKKHQCEKLTFSGTVGDPRRAVMYLVQRYSFEPQPSPEAGTHLYQVRSGRLNSELRIKPATVVRSSTPHLRYEMELLISR